MLLVRALARVVTIVLMVVLALGALAVSLYCLNRAVGLGAASPPHVLHLPTVRRQVGRFLHDLTTPGPTAGLALVCGLGAMALGLLLLAGVLVPRRTRLALLDADGDAGMLAARRSTLRDVARALADQADGATHVKRARLRLARRGTRGRLTVVAACSNIADAAEVQRAVTDRVAPVTQAFHLRPRVRVQPGGPGERVQ